MSDKATPIIPIFLPQRACPQRCIYCNQRLAVGVARSPSPDEAKENIQRIIDQSEKCYEVAFYGGSISAMSNDELENYLSAVGAVTPEKRILGIRISTRPDAVSPQTIKLFKRFGVKTVELGVQSLDEEVLSAVRRGHNAQSVYYSTHLLQDAGIAFGHHLMLGLPQQTGESFVSTVERTIELKPDTVRLHPTLVLEETELAEMWRRGDYIPMELETAVENCAWALEVFLSADIKVIRMGVQETDSLRSGVMSGPHHPSFGELVVSLMLRRRIEQAIKKKSPNKRQFSVLVPPQALSLFIGQRRSNIEHFQKDRGWEVEIKPAPQLKGYEFKII